MKWSTAIIVLLVSITLNTFGQVSTGKVSSLVAAENYFAAKAKENGLREAFLRVSDDETLVFRPQPVSAEEFYDKKQADPGELIWEPSYARISRSGDWGFTTGPYIYTDFSDSSKSYGQYLSIWRATNRGIWKLALDIGTPHPKPKIEPQLNFTDPKDLRFFRQLSPVRLKQREEMIMATDRLFASALKKSSALGYHSFIGENARLLFPGSEPIIGKENIKKFIYDQGINIFSESVDADRSIGSDLAYSYGTAQITRNNTTAKYNYVRIWESQEGFKWNVIVELFSPAD
ncbi:MAG: nuclear transport factor 2 family protein [Daejeonella sp.]|uniref:nuclear transport factor 2 family protein n=1 Tax=Daejeonella sp. TaxID=2805397 RepID=UPI003C790D12